MTTNRSLNIGIARKIDGKKNSLLQYCMISEYAGDAVLVDNLSETDVVKIFVDLCKATYYLHTKDIVFGEICFDMTTVVKNNSGYTLKLKDLAVAEFYKRNDGDNPYFKAPEVVLEGTQNHQSDIYSLGVFLFCLASKRHNGRNFKADYVAFKSAEQNPFAQKLIPLIDNMTADIKNPRSA